jgi:hypothetical protein
LNHSKFVHRFISQYPNRGISVLNGKPELLFGQYKQRTIARPARSRTGAEEIAQDLGYVALAMSSSVKYRPLSERLWAHRPAAALSALAAIRITLCSAT